jgi:hypothetical protein
MGADVIVLTRSLRPNVKICEDGLAKLNGTVDPVAVGWTREGRHSMLIAMTLLTVVAGFGVADRVWRSRGEADLRRRWRSRPRVRPWHLT